MDAKLCRDINLLSMELIAKYFNEPLDAVIGLYNELLSDKQFLSELNEQITFARKYHKKGIFKHEAIDCIDWFGVQRILVYIVTRLKKPDVFVETGVFYGGNTAFILGALRKNNKGTLYSFDLPANEIQDINRHHLVGDSEFIPPELDVGFIVHSNLKNRWQLIRGDSHKELPKLNKQIDIFMHDSDHSHDFILKEFNLIWEKLTPTSIILADDLDWSNGFFKVCVDKKLMPLIITDNGKSGLLARTGLARLDHPFTRQPDVVGT